MVVALVSNTFTKIFGSRNDRMVKAYHRRVQRINELEPETRKLNDAQLRAKTVEFRQRISGGENVTDVMPEILAVARETMDRAVGIRNIFNPEAGFDVNRLPERLRPMYAEIFQKAQAIEPQPVPGGEPAPGWMQVEIPNEIYEAVREIYPKSRPPFRARPFDVQLIGGMVLSEGKISEMKTGEGKTIVAPLACYVACMESLQCHVVTVNDYLVQRDRDWVFPFYYHAGLSVGAIHPYHMQPPELKKQAYECDVVYGTNSEFGFDYLRDNMKLSVEEQVQRRKQFCIIDEVDSILIDEARTPLIISGPAHDDAPRYDLADQVARHLIQKQREWDAANTKVQQCLMRIKGLEGDIRNARDKASVPPMRDEMKSLQEQLPQLEDQRDLHTQYYELEMEKKAAHLTHHGVAEAQKLAGIGSFYVGNNMDFPHLLENALRAHAVYQRDKDYVVQNGEVVIVDEFTGRLMIGRQWSDGLHQAVEAKERVKIKQETQTLATVTIQNFFKLYNRLAGMTGTALTEATEFDEIYKLDVVSIPTNVSVVRTDQDDLIFLSQKDKWGAILDEIKRMHDIGRPVLVGTTSVEKSELLSDMLTRKHGVRHEVLNAKQHEREAHIVQHAGELGAVMIATNMAGRGTDIKLTPINRDALIKHWKVRNMISGDARPDMTDEQLIDLFHRHQARSILGTKPSELEQMSAAQIRLQLLRYWVHEQAFVDQTKAVGMTEEQCVKTLDKVVGFLAHRVEIFKHIEQMGGLAIVGTERHEARRIDNQLRGRAGRQGDKGSSRFFMSLEDDLMKLFAGKTTLTALSKLGMKEGNAIEHRWITKSVERAQRKVEQRNYEIRKNLLEYDEVMEHQRNAFYGIRQEVLEGRNIESIIFDYLTEAITDAAGTYLDRDYVPTQIAEWCRQNLDVSIDPAKLRLDDLETLQRFVRTQARSEIGQIVEVTLGEYMSDDLPPEDWDLKGLSAWAMTRFKVDLKQNQVRQMNVEQVKQLLIGAANELVERHDVSPLAKFLDKHYAEARLAEWAKLKFGIELKLEELSPKDNEKRDETQDRVVAMILDKARELYRQREVRYPVEFVLEMAFQAGQQNGQWAAEQLALWVKNRYELDWTTEHVLTMNGQQLYELLTKEAQTWLHDGKLERAIDAAMEKHRDPELLAQWAQQRFGRKLAAADLGEKDHWREVLIRTGRGSLRRELTQLERFVLLQILDHAWKDHLYAMDQLKDSVGLRGYAERDPRIEYKREGSNQFTQMRSTVRDRVSELIFKARLTPQVEVKSVYQQQQAQHAQAGSLIEKAAQTTSAGSAEQQADQSAAQQAGAGEDSHLTRKQRRAAAAKERHNKPEFKERKRR